jgi:hypothetical protein
MKAFINRTIGTRLTKAVSWIGKISFSLYLIHFPLFKLFGYLHRDIFGEKPANFLISLFLSTSRESFLHGSSLGGWKTLSISGRRKKEIHDGKSWKDLLFRTPTGNTFVRALLNHINDQNQLEKFLTTIGAGGGANYLISAFCAEKRQYAIPDKIVSRQWMPEFARLLSKGDQAKKA